MRRSLGWVALVSLLIPLTGASPIDAPVAYEKTRQLLINGDLSRAQQEAERYSQSLREREPRWSRKFRLLDVEILSRRGMYEEALKSISQPSFAPLDVEDTIQTLTLRGIALARIGKTLEASQDLANADGLCAAKSYSECGSLFRAHGVFALERGESAAGRRFFLQSLNFERTRRDRLQEATSLLNLGAAALREEHFDEALDWSRLAYRIAIEINAKDVGQIALGNQGWAYYGLGDFDRALQFFDEAEHRSAELGDLRMCILWYTTTGDVYARQQLPQAAEESYRRALKLAEQIGDKSSATSTSMELAEAYVQEGKLDEAERYAAEAETISKQNGNRVDILYSRLIRGQASALRGDLPRAESLLFEVERAPESELSMKWAAEFALAKLYQSQRQFSLARDEYESALATFETARSQLKSDDSKLPFIANATRIYDDYIHFLVTQGKSDAALATADQSRARTLAQGLGQTANQPAFRPAPLSPQTVARKANSTLLFYWLGERQSYLWAVTPQKTALFTLPAQNDIAPQVERYRRALLGIEDPLEANNAAGLELYKMLVAPAAGLLSPNARVMILADGALSQLNFETLIVPSTDAAHKAHYWIEDAIISSAPSMAMLDKGLAEREKKQPGKLQLLLLGDPVTPSEDYPKLPYARQEITEIRKRFRPDGEEVFASQLATPEAYLKSHPEQFSYIHFVSHGVASRMDPLDSAIILSRPESGGEDSFKLYAREVMRHPIDARLVTISACYGTGTRTYAGEGLVGLSWAFLRAGAQRTIGALWEASDSSTPELMSALYAGLEAGETPAASLRNAKLKLLHSRSNFRKPFYWAPFQLYTRV